MAEKKYISPDNLAQFLDNLPSVFSQKNHTHTASDIGAAESTHTHNDIYYTEAEIDTKLAKKSDTSHNHDSAYDKKGAASTVQANLDVVNDELNAHVDDTDIHVSASNKSDWNTAYAHSQSTHARTDATKVADSTTNGNILINGTETNVYTHPASGVTAGTYKSVTVDKNGHITKGTNPTTLSGYGITDAETKGAASTALTNAKEYTDEKIEAEVENRDSAIATAKSAAISTAAETAQTKADAALASAKSYVDTKTSGLASTSTINSKISTHDTSTSAHGDIRSLISDLTTRLNNFLDVDDTTADQLSEIVTLINNNKGTLESLTTSKINVSDIVDNLTTSSTSKVLSANQGVAIKALIDALQTAVDGKASSSHSHTITASASDDDVVVLKGTNGTNKVTYSASHANSGVTAGTYKSVTVNAKGHVTAGSNPTTLSGYGITDAAKQTDLDTHASDTTVHITSTERSNWDAAKTHADSAHAPSNAEKNQNAFSNIKVGSTTVAADTATDTVAFAGTNVTITPDATNDTITFAVANGSTSAKGVVQLTNSTSSTSTTTAATPNSVKTAYDLANTAKTNAATAQSTADGKVSKSGDTMTGDLKFSANNVDRYIHFNHSDTSARWRTGVEGSGSGNENYFVIESDKNVNDGEFAKALYIGMEDLNAHFGANVSATKFIGNLTGNASTATKATKDASGNTITSTYETKTDATAKLTEAKTYTDTVASGKANSSHTHNYAGSSSAGGAATSANKLNTNAGSATNPVYFANGIPVKTTYTLGKSVPSDAKFTDTTYSAATTSEAGLMSAADKTKLNYTNIAYGTCSTDAATAAKVITVSGNTNWALTAGSTIIVKFSYTNTASNPTFNVNGTGDKSVWYGTALITTSSSSLAYAGYANRPMIFTYDGTQYVFMGWSYDANTTYNNASLGQGYGTCATEASTVAKVVTLSSYSLQTGGIVSVKFTYDVPASATMNINSKGAKSIYYKGAAITGNIIKAGDIATFIYSTQYHLLSIDRWQKDINDIQTELDSINTEIDGSIKSLSVSGKTITYTKNNGTTGTITTQDTNTDTKVTQTATTSNASYPILLAPSGQTATATTTSYFDSGVTLNPSTNTIAANISGNAATATKANASTRVTTSDGSNDVERKIVVDAGSESGQNLYTVPSVTANYGKGTLTASGGFIGNLSGNATSATTASTVALKAGDNDKNIWQVYGSTPGSFGYRLQYNGSGSGNNNSLQLIADNQEGDEVVAMTVKQDGTTTFAKAITASGGVVGNASTATTATKLGTSTIGSSSQPIYLSSGTATKVSAVGTAYGGTGATSVSGARTNLDVYSKSEVDTKVAAVKNDLLNGAGSAYDTLKELGDLIDDNTDAIDALETVAAGKANASHAHGNITNAGAIGSASGKAVITTTNGVLTTGTVPIASGGTGATTAANALKNLGITATAAELNKMDGVTATTAELNYVDGVTSNIQTQLDGKAASSHTHDASVLLNALSDGNSNPTDDICYITQYATDPTNTTYYKRPHKYLWGYIKDKISSILGLTSTSYGGNAKSATKLATARTIALGTGATGTATSFDGSANITIPVTAVKEAYLTWGGKNFAGDYAPIDAAMIPSLGANRLAFMPAAGVVIEYSTDGGSTWSTYSTTDDAKINLFNGNGNSYYIGASTAKEIDKSKYMLRVTIETSTARVYTALNKFAINCSTDGSSGCYCTISARTQANYASGTDTWKTFTEKASLSGWSGWNIINPTSSITTYGNSDSHYRQVRFTFGVTSHASTVKHAGLRIIKILGFGGMGHTTPSTMAAHGRMYTYDASQNVTFPAKVTATTFVGALSGNASTATKATQDGSGNVITSTYATKTELDTLDSAYDAHKHTVSHTPAGTVSQPTFTGSSATSGAPSGTSTVASSTHTHKYTPAGTVSQPTFTGSAVTSGASSGTTSVYSITNVGSAPSLSASVTNRCLTLAWSAGSVPTRSSVTLPSTSHTHSVTANGTVSAPTFTGTEASTTSISGTTSVASSGHTHSVTAKGTVSAPTFTGTEATLTTGTPK